MNLQRLEMMRLMMERVVAGSWQPDQSVCAEINRPKILPLKVEGVALNEWRSRKTLNPSGDSFCGFNACAVGHACFDEEFRKLGWRWDSSVPTFGGRNGWVAIAKFFEFPHVTNPREGMGELLFGSFSYNNKIRDKYANLPAKTREAKMVADRIQYLIQHGSEQTRTAIKQGLV